MADPIQMICSLSGCTQEEAERAFTETEDVIEAVDRLLAKKPSAADKYLSGKKRPREVTPEEQVVSKFRNTLKHFDDLVSTSLYRPAHEGQDETRDPHEETAQQTNCFQQCQLPSLQEGAQTQETACPLQSECSSDLQLNVQT
jgi:hypothetical protein